MQNKPLLSICIPTWNREKYLKECLDSIINQQGFDEKDIEIVISDNASTDNTTQLVKSYQKIFTNIIYHRNHENIGGLKNVLKLPKLASGEYIWFLSDDDLISYIGISETINIIKKEKSDFILSKFMGFWNGEVIDNSKVNIKGDIINIIGLNNFFEFLGKVKYDITPYIMLLSIFCFKKELYINNFDALLKENGDKFYEFIETNFFPHSFVIYSKFGNDKKITVIEKDLILCRGGNISWSPNIKACKDLLYLFKYFKNNYIVSNKAYKKFKKIYYYSLFLYIVIVYIQKILPKFLYNFLVKSGRKLIRLLNI